VISGTYSPGLTLAVAFVLTMSKKFMLFSVQKFLPVNGTHYTHPADLFSGRGASECGEGIRCDQLSTGLANISKNLCIVMDPFPDLSLDVERDATSAPLLIIGDSQNETLPGRRVEKTAVESVGERPRGHQTASIPRWSPMPCFNCSTTLLTAR
jgi:hypothetical protein